MLMLKNCRAACNYAHRKFNRPKGVVHHTEIRKQHKLCKLNSLPFMVSSIASRIFVFMLLQSLLSISKVDPPQYTWHSLTLARPLTKLVTGHFKKMIGRDVPICLVKILCYWYQHQEMIVQWGSCLTNAVLVTNGVRQGGILSPMLFNIYIDGLSDILNKSTIGCSIGGNCINHMLYADDLCIVSLSSAGLQQYLYNVMITVKNIP